MHAAVVTTSNYFRLMATRQKARSQGGKRHAPIENKLNETEREKKEEKNEERN